MRVDSTVVMVKINKCSSRSALHAATELGKSKITGLPTWPHGK